MSVKQTSKGRFVFAEILEYLGKMGVMCSSLFILIVVFFIVHSTNGRHFGS